MSDTGKKGKQPDWAEPELATLTRDRFSDPAWLYERKLDGERCLSFRTADGVRMMTRNQKEVSANYPEVAAALREVAALPDPVGTAVKEWTRPNGLKVARRRIPLGVIAIIYESRPNVTTDAAAVCLRAGNATILTGSQVVENGGVATATIVSGGALVVSSGGVASRTTLRLLAATGLVPSPGRPGQL